jgi:hypothetical protein
MYKWIYGTGTKNQGSRERLISTRDEDIGCSGVKKKNHHHRMQLITSSLSASPPLPLAFSFLAS